MGFYFIIGIFVFSIEIELDVLFFMVIFLLIFCKFVIVILEIEGIKVEVKVLDDMFELSILFDG